MFVNNVRDIGQCRVIIIITIIIITLFTVMKSGAPLLGLAKYIYILLYPYRDGREEMTVPILNKGTS